jgi:hypothetical protein
MSLRGIVSKFADELHEAGDKGTSAEGVARQLDPEQANFLLALYPGAARC